MRIKGTATLELATHLQGNNTEHYIQNQPFLTVEQERIVQFCLPFVQLDSVIKNVYKSYLIDPYYQSIKALNISLAALTEVKHNHFRMISESSLIGDTASYCFIDLGTIYAKVGLSEALLERSVELFAEAFIDGVRKSEAINQLKYPWLAINDAYQLLFQRYKEIALAAHDYYFYLQSEQTVSEQAPLSIRTVDMTPEHLFICVNPLSDYLNWHEVSDYALSLLSRHPYRHVYLDLSGLVGREPDEKELIVFDFQQYCFIKSIELYVIGLSLYHKYPAMHKMSGVY